MSTPSKVARVIPCSPDIDAYIRTITSYQPISRVQARTFAPCMAAYMASSSVKTDLPRPDSPKTVYIFPEIYSPMALNFDFHTLKDSPTLRRSYSARNLSVSFLTSVPTLSRTSVLILTDSSAFGNHESTNSFPPSSFNFRSNSPVSNQSTTAFFAEKSLIWRTRYV